MFVRASQYKRREENQLDATECFITQPAALLLTAEHQQPRHYTPYAAVTQV